MFVMSQSASFTWPVQVEVPVSGGKFERQSFDAEFKRLPQSRIRALIQAEGQSDSEFCREVLIGWRGVADEAKHEVPFSEQARDMLLDVPQVAAAIVTAFLESLSNAKRKN